MKTTDLRHWMCRNACVDKSEGDGAKWKCAWKMSMSNKIWIEHSGCWPNECDYCPANPKNKNRPWHDDCPCASSKESKHKCSHINEDGSMTWCEVGEKTRMYETIDDTCRLNNIGARVTYAHVFNQVTGGCPMFALRTPEEVATFLEMAWISVGPKRWDKAWKVSGVFQRNGKVSKWVQEAEAYCGQPIITKHVEEHFKKYPLKKKEKQNV